MQDTATPRAATPRPAPRPIVAEKKIPPDTAPATPVLQGHDPSTSAALGNLNPRAADLLAATIEDVATIPDPITATIAILELERSEIDVTIETLRRLQGRRAARA